MPNDAEKIKMPKSLPSYQELAKLVCDLTEHNIANLTYPPDHWFVCCYTYDTGSIPFVYQRAIAARMILRKEGLV